MKVVNKYLICLILTIVLTLTFSSLYADDLSGKTYYTKTNIWYENPNKISSTNYHKGAILPIGTKVSIHSINDRGIRFTSDGSGQMFTIINDKQTNTISIDELFKRYFSVEKFQIGDGDYQATEAERENIKTGMIAIGMSKKAILMAYGYPPTHKTPLLTSDVWYYWYAHLPLVEVDVFFKDDKVFKIEKIEPPGFHGFTRSTVDSEGGIKKAK